MSNQPAEFSGDEVAIGREGGGVLVHAADEAFPAGLVLEAHADEDRVEFEQNRGVEGVVRIVGATQRRRNEAIALRQLRHLQGHLRRGDDCGGRGDVGWVTVLDLGRLLLQLEVVGLLRRQLALAVVHVGRFSWRRVHCRKSGEKARISD
jgi:hypothetical protein